MTDADAVIPKLNCTYATSQDATMTKTHFLRQATVIDAIVLAVPPVFAKLFSSLNLGPSGIDPWLYYAYATNYGPNLQRFGWTYYASRLAWNLIVKFYFSIFDPTVALFLLGTTISALGSISLYAILRNYYSRPAALLTAFSLAANSWYLGSAFWLYVDGPAIATALFSIATFIHGVRNGRSLSFYLSGAAFAIGMNMHPIVLLLVIPCFGLILMAERVTGRRRLLMAVAGFSAAALATMLALCVVAWLALGNFWFFMSSVTAAEWVVSGGWHNWVLPFSSWVRGATALLMPIGVLFAGVIVFGSDAIRRRLGRDVWIFAYALLLGAGFVLSDTILQAGRLQHSYYFIYLWIPSFLLLGSVFARLIDRVDALTPFAMVGAGIIALGTLAFAGEYWLLHVQQPVFLTAVAYVVLATFFLVFGSVVCFSDANGGVPKLLGIFAGVAFVSIATAADYRGGASNLADRALWQYPGSMADFGVAVDAQRFIESNIDRGRKLLIWYDANSRGSTEFTAINSTFLYSYSRLNDSMPQLTDADLHKMDVPSSVVLLSADPDEADRAIDGIRKRGLLERVSARTGLGPHGKRIGIWIVEARSAADAKAIANGQSITATDAHTVQAAGPLPIDWGHVSLEAGSSFGSSDHWPLTVQTPVQPWSYGAQLPFDSDAVSLSTPLHIRTRATVLSGRIGIGLLNRAKDAFVQIEYFSASPRPFTVTLSAPDRRDIGPLVIRTGEEPGPAKIKVESIELVTELVAAPITIDWRNIERPTVSLEAFPLEIRTPARAWAYGAVIPLRVAAISSSARVTIRIRAHVTEGEAAFGLLSDQNDAIRGEAIRNVSDGNQSILLQADGTADPIRLVIQSGPAAVPAMVVVDGIEAETLP